MSDDFGTVSVRRAERARELQVLRQQYREHRDALNALADNAPTDFLATEYQRLVEEIDAALAKLEELEGHGEMPRTKTQPGARPIVHSPGMDEDPAAPRTYVSSAAASVPNTQSRIIIMIVAGLVVLGLIGWLIWRAGGDRRRPATRTAAQPTTTESINDTAAPSTISPVTPAPAATRTVVPVAGANALTISPALADYGTIRKGTRSTRQFQVVNTSAAPVTITVARSACRCLYYEYTDRLQPKKKETITVTVDGARVKPGILQETIQVTGKSDPSIAASFQVQATIK